VVRRGTTKKIRNTRIAFALVGDDSTFKTVKTQKRPATKRLWQRAERDGNHTVVA
jgi:hypothetical protein